MIASKLTALLIGKQYIGIEHYSLENEELTALLRIEKTKEGLSIVKKDKVPQDILAEKWDKSLPFFLVINTNQVIQKEVLGTEPNDEKILHRAFPNIAWTEFYYEIFRMQSKSVIAISRKSYVDQLLMTYSKQSVSIAGISLGIASLSEIVKFSEESTIHTNTQIISFKEGEQTIQGRKEYTEKTHELNGLSVGSSHVMPFSGILSLLLKDGDTTGNVTVFNEQLKDDYNQKTFFSKSLKIFIGVILGVLLINFFAFNHYYKKAEEASQNLLLNKSSNESIKKVKERISSKEQKLKNTIDFASSKSALIVNEITKGVPHSILLSELVFNPLQKKIKEQEPISTDEHTILISGTTLDNYAFTNWMDSIENLKSINKVIILHFGKNDANETVFSIKIKLNEDGIK
ncbi:hypothetical protein ACI6PS_07860 [Flavobacterium sp. PLA-1-15]|uniref:hypothetical protein n=1 Tax=Flavobacterium sp. PLA-1-15 TaxID=3380533 RepID=UPI003B800036